MKEAKQVSEKVDNVKNDIQTFMKSLAEEGMKREQCAGDCSDVPPQDYIMEQILRAMAKRNRLKLKDKIKLTTDLSFKMIPGKNTDLNISVLQY